MAGQDYDTRFTGHPTTVWPVRWHWSEGRWQTEIRPMPAQTRKTTLEALPSELQESIRKYQARWSHLLPPGEPFPDSSWD